MLLQYLKIVCMAPTCFFAAWQHQDKPGSCNKSFILWEHSADPCHMRPGSRWNTRLTAPVKGLTMSLRTSSCYLMTARMPLSVLYRSVHPSINMSLQTNTEPPLNWSCWTTLSTASPEPLKSVTWPVCYHANTTNLYDIIIYIKNTCVAFLEKQTGISRNMMVHLSTGWKHNISLCMLSVAVRYPRFSTGKMPNKNKS